MNCHVMRGLLALYPRDFRDRYGAELAGLTDELISAGEITPLLATLNLVWGAIREWGRVLIYSRRAVQAVAAAAIMAVAGTLYVTSQARPQNTPAGDRGASAPAYWLSGGCVLWTEPAGSVALRVVGVKVVGKRGQFSWVAVPQTGVTAGQLSRKTPPWPAGGAHASLRRSPAGRCVISVKAPS